ncbi:UNVERIFIED_CONTAM: thiamine biosynthesis lipoprotein [Williamsia faeni]
MITTRAWVEQIMGMPISVHVRALDIDRAEIGLAVEQVFTHLRRADAVFSTYNADSGLMRLRHGRLAAAEVDPWIGKVDKLCRAATDATGGLFTSDLLGPDGTRGWDPTGLVKGWAVRDAAEHLRNLDHVGFSINAGGDIVCGLGRGSTALASPWRIGIQDPNRPGVIARVVDVVDGALATSGTVARGNHIIDPRSGAPVRRRSSTTVIGPDLMWADIWATATFVDTAALTDRPEWSAYTLLLL